jgi:hypothetical protein
MEINMKLEANFTGRKADPELYFYDNNTASLAQLNFLI